MVVAVSSGKGKRAFSDVGKGSVCEPSVPGFVFSRGTENLLFMSSVSYYLECKAAHRGETYPLS